MQKKRLGNSDMELTPIGVGAWAMGGGGWAFAWGPQDDDESIAAIHAALDRGVNWIDTAAVYGLGHSEEVVARALAGRAQPAVRLHQVRARLEREAARSAAASRPIRSAASARASLRRLKVDAIDLYQIHWPEPDEDIEEGWSDAGQAAGGGQGALDRRLQFQRGADGALPHDRAHHLAAAAVFGRSRRRSKQETLPYCQQHGIGVIVYSPMKSGLLTGDDDPGARGRTSRRTISGGARRPSRSRSLTRNLALAELMKAIGARHGRSAGEVAIAWTLRHPAVTAAIVGMRSAEQVEGVIGALEFRLSAEEIAEIESFRAVAAAS